MATPEEMQAKMVQSIEEQTGKSIDELITWLQAQQLEKHMEKVKLVKAEWGLGHGFANLLAHLSKSEVPASEPDLVELQFEKKPELRPIYDALIAYIKDWPDLEIAPKKSYVSLRTKKQFGLIQPSTKTRLDLGLNFPATATGIGLEASGSFNAMVSHRIRLQAVADITEEVRQYIRQAYESSRS
ncbi:MAG: DUF4287 domain-containing protein [Phaeodactylibacter sp.]|nr:DUF4287 domain-containing protein [Phaeodactylibacter sp.]